MEKTDRITCIAKAIKDKKITGKFSKNNHQYIFPAVENIDSKGNKSEWIILVEAYNTKEKQSVPIIPEYYTCPIKKQPPKEIVGIYFTKIKRHTGHEQISEKTIISEGKNLDKKNASTPISQAISQAYRLYQNKLKKSNKLIDIKDVPRPPPMLLKKIEESKSSTLSEEDYNNGVIIQPKLDGIRAICHVLSNQQVEFYSRTGLEYSGLDHISVEIIDMINNQNKYKNTEIFLDGEIYIKNVALQNLSGAVRGEDNKLKEKLQFHIFDCFIISKNENDLKLKQNERLTFLKSIYREKYKFVKLVEPTIVHDEDKLFKIYKNYLKEGYEGAIVRRVNSLYKFSLGKQRTNDVLKLKPFSTDEYKIVDYKEGEKGKDKGAVIFILKTEDGEEFSAVPKETQTWRKELYNRFKTEKKLFEREYKNKYATIQYATLSSSGTPSQPKYLGIRTEE